MGQCLSHEDAVSGVTAHVANLKKAPHALPINVEFGYKRNFEAHYVRGKELGRGQFGVTYAARNLESQEQVAVKMILKKTVSGRLLLGSTIVFDSGSTFVWGIIDQNTS